MWEGLACQAVIFSGARLGLNRQSRFLCVGGQRLCDTTQSFHDPRHQLL